MQTITINDNQATKVTVDQVVNNVSVSEEDETSLVITQNNMILEVAPDIKQTVVIEARPTIVSVTGEQATNVIEISAPGIQGPAGVGVEYTGPEFTYDDEDRVLRVDYDDGSYKTFEYDDGLLTRIDFAISGGDTIRKDFVYSDGLLIRVDQTTV